MRARHKLIYVALFGLLAANHAYASCGSGACAVNTNWDEHSASQPGLSLDLRHSYSRADQLRSGTGKVAADSADSEVENLRSITKITTLTADYTPNQNWGITVNLPYVSRDHMHNLGPYAPDSLGVESFNAQAPGDIKLTGRYRMTLNEEQHSSIGIKLGTKLANGRKDVAWDGTTTIPGEVALQPGNGSTDLILGAFWNQAAPGNTLSWFAQTTLQNSVRHDDVYRPGNQINVDGGARYNVGGGLNALLQLNAQWNDADSGSSAPLTATGGANSGGNALSVTPGLSYALAAGTNVYSLVQLPIYQSVNGQQLTANYSVTAGINHRF
jgi:hypothetical protein